MLGLVGATGVIPQEPASAAVSVAQVSNWKLDAGTGTTAVDSVGGKTATLNSGAGWTSGLRGGSSLTVNGTSGAATTSGAVLNTSGSYSVSAYVKLNTLTGFQTIASQDGSRVSGFYLQLRGDTGRFAFSRESVDASGSLTTYAGAAAAPVVGQWYHLTGVFNATARTVALYVNGRLQATTATAAGFTTSGSFAMGRAKYDFASADFLNGTIDEVRAYSGVLTADDVEQIADSAWYKLDEGSGTTAVDAGLTAINGTLVNGPTYTPGPLNSALAFDGTNDHIDANRQTFDSSKSFSVTAWARATQPTSSRVVASGDGTNTSGFLLATTSTGRWAFSRPASDSASATSATVASTALVTAGTWYHLAAVYDSVADTLTLFVDGVKQGTSVSYTTGWRANGDFIVGRGLTSGAPAGYFSGGIDEVHTYPFAIDAGMAAQLADPTPPPTPAAPTATSPTATSVTVSWVAPNPISGSPTTGYVVTPYVNGVAQAPQTFNSTATTQTFSGLTTGSSYRYTVAAINANGTSSASPQSVAVVPATAVPGAPTAVVATAGTQSATVSWTAPSTNGGSAITGYVVTPYAGSTALTSQTFASTATSQRITGLTAGTAYTFRVAARNAAGTGPASTASTAVTPNALPTLTFADPPAGSVGVAYSTQLTVTGGTSPFVWSITAGTLPGGVTLSSTGLLSGTPTATGTYTVTVRAADASGESATKAVTLVITGAPAAPARPTATAGLGEATVSWVAPASNGATITGYIITPYLAGVAQTPITVDAAATTRVVTGLTAGGSYTFTVAAVNARGTSSASAASVAVVPYAVLTAPAITSVRAGSSSAVLTWSAPSSDGGSTIVGYVVTPYIGSVAQAPQTFAGTATTRTVTGLTPGTAYTFRVAAQNASGATSLFRVNAGGPLVASTDGGPNWAADNTTDSIYRNSGSGTTASSPSATLDRTVPAGTPLALFDSDRYDFPANEDMLWRFPVTAGAAVKVRLYFANRYVPTGQVGNRVFDVSLDGSRVLNDFDIVAGAGSDQTATMREFTLTSDGTVDISFGAEVENPQVNAIEIIQTGLDATGPTSAASTPVTPNASPTLAFAAPPAGQVGVPYSQALVVTGGTSPFVWSVVSGSLPAGLTLNATTGLLSGTPTAAGTSDFTVQVTDASGESATKAVTLVVAAALAVSFTPVAGEVSVAYSQQPTRTGGTAPYRWAITAGSLPAGLSVNADTGLISGTPTASATSSFTLTVTDGLGAAVSRTTSIAIAALPTLTFAAPAAGQVAVAYSTSFTAAGGTAPLVWSIAAGNVPSGLTLSTGTGVLSGTPTTAGSSTFTVLVTDSFGKTASRAVTLVITSGPLLITKTADVSSVAPGGTVKYTITVNNTATSTFTGVAVSDPLAGVLDDAVYNADAAATSGSLSYASSTLAWTGDLAAGATATITYSVKVNDPDLGNKVLANSVTSSTLGTNCPSGGGAADCTATVTVSGLSIVHTAGAPTTTPGSSVTFSIVVTNTGQTAYTGASFTESLTGMLDDATYTGATTTSGNLSYTSPALSWTGNLGVGASATITYTLVVANPDPGNKSLAGTVVSTTAGSSCPGGNPAASCTATVSVLVPALSITNTAGVSTTTPGSTVPYTVTLANTGQTAYSGTSVSIALAGVLDDATYNGGAAASAGTVAFDAGTKNLIWTGSLAVAASVTITASVTVLNPDPGDKVLTSVASSSAAGSTCPPGSSNSPCTSTVQVLIPALTITKSSSVTSTTPGSLVAYTILVTNTGQTAYTGATLSDNLTGVLDDAVYGGNAAATSGTVSATGGSVVWTGSLDIGASATITYSVTVNNPDNGNRSLVGIVTSTTPGSNCASGSGDARCTSTVPVLIPGLTITTTADVATTTPGSKVRYTTTVINSGQTSYSGAEVQLFFAGLVDDAVSDGVATVSTGSLSPAAGNQAVWTLSLTPGQSATVSSTFTVRSPDPGDKLMVASATSSAAGSTCPTGTTNTSCSVTVRVLIPGLTITKTANAASVVTGGTVGYTIVVRNSGETAYTAAAFTDSLSSVLDDAVYAGGAVASTGTVSYTAPTLAWSGSLAVGATATITYSVVVRDPDPGDKRMTNTAVSTTAGSNCASTSTDSRCTASVDVLVPGLTIAKTADVASTVPGGTVRFTVQVTNSGATPQTGATFVDSLSSVLDDATYAGGATTTAGTLSYAGSTLTWTGDLAVGASATISYTTTVKVAPEGNNRLTNVAVSSTRGSNCAAGSADARCQVDVPVSRLVLERVPVPPATTTPGSVLDLSVRFTNTGQVPYVGIAVDIPRADSSDDLFATGPDTASSGTLVRTTSTTQWTGDIPVGGSVTVTIIRTVRDPATGNREIRAPLQSDAPGSNCPTVGATDPRCTFLTQVLVPGLTITKSASATSVEPGGTVGYTVLIRNTGQTAYPSAAVSDSLAGVLDDAVYNANAVASAGTVSYAAPVLTWTGSLAVGASVTVTYSVTVNSPGTGDKAMTSRISSTDAGSSCPPASTSTGCLSSVQVLTPALTITKSANTATTTLGATVAYTVLVANTGQTSYPAAGFSDSLAGVLDDATYLPGATTASTGTVGLNSGVLSWSGALAPGQSATITYSVSVNNPATGNLVLTNQVTSASDGSNCAGGSGDGRCSSRVEVLNTVALSIVKTASVASTVPGAQVTFTLRLTNPTDITIIGATVTDALGDVLDDASYTGSTANVGVVGLSGSNLTWTGNVAARRTVTVTYTVVVDKAGAGNELLTATTVSTSPATSNSCLPGSTDPGCTVTVPIAQLDLVQTADVTNATPGSTITVTAVYTNTGQVPYTGISVASPRADTSDDTVPSGDQTASSGVLVRTTAALTWTGDIPVGGSVTVTRTLTVRDPDPGNKIITATLQSTAPGNNCPAGTTDPRCTFSVAVLVPGLTITKTADKTFVQPGESVGYTITIKNSGQAPYSAATVSDSLPSVLDDADYNADASATAGAVSYTSATIRWTGALAVGATVIVTYTTTSRLVSQGDKVMINGVTSTDAGSTCPPASGNAACRTTVGVLTPALTITKTADVTNATLGSTVTFTVRVTNTGQTYYPAASLTDPLAGVLDDAAYAGNLSADSGSASYDPGVVSWSGALVPGQSAVITYSVQIANPASGNRTMINTVTSTTAGNNCATGSTDGRCTATVSITDAVSLTITKTADVITTAAGNKINYSVTVTNSSASTVTAANFSDPLAGVLDDATYGADATASSGVVSYTAPVLSWVGDVPAGATVTVRYSVTVNNPVAGNLILSGTVTSTSLPTSNNCVAGSTDPRCTSSVPVARLEIAYGPVPPTAVPGQQLTFTQTYKNTGQVPYVGISVDTLAPDFADDTLPGVQTASSGTLSVGLTGVTWTGDIPVGGTVALSATVQVKDPDTGDRVMKATSVSTAPGSNCPTGSTDPRCSLTINVLVPGLTITKTASATTVTPGDPVVFTIVVRNSGETAYTGARVTDSLTEVLDDGVLAGPPVADAGSVSDTGEALEWTGNLAVAATATITYSVTANNPGTGDKAMFNTVSSDEAGSTCPTTGGGAGCSASVQVLTPALTIVKSASTATTTLGATVTYSVVVTNTGQTSYPAAGFSDSLAGVLDDATYLPAATTASSGTVSSTGGVLSWSGALALGQAATISYAVSVNNPAIGDLVLANQVTSASDGSNCAVGSGDDRCSSRVEVLNSVALSIVKTASVASTVPGDSVTFTLRLTNPTGTTIFGATVTDSLTDVLDDAAYTSSTANVGVVSFSGSNLTWTGNVAARRTVTVTYTVTVGTTGAGNELLTAKTVSTSPSTSNSCLPGSTDPGCTATVPVAQLDILQTADRTTATPGDLIRVVGTFTNTGQAGYTGISITLDTSNVTDDAVPEGDTASSGSLVRTASGLTWTGDIPVGATIDTARLLRVKNPDPGNKLITATHRSDAPGNNCGPASTDARCAFAVTVLIPGLTITKTANATAVVPSGVVGYTITVRNSGQTPYTGATVTDSLIGVLDDATYNGGANATTGTVSYTSPDLTWTGDLAVGQEATITFGVTAHRPADGDKTMANRVSSVDAGSTCPPNSGTPGCTNTVEVRTPALTTVLTADKATALPGEVVTYTATATNNGQTNYAAASFTVPLDGLLDDAGYTGAATATSGTVARVGNSLDWTGALVQGAQATITYSVTVKDPVPVTGLAGNHRLEQTLTSAADGSNCLAASTDPRCSTSVPIASLRIVNSVDVTSAKPTDKVSYTGTFTNTGQVPYVGVTIADSFVGTLDNATYNGDASADSGSVIIVVGSGQIVWTGDVAVGQTVTIRGSVTVNNPKTGNGTLATRITTDAPASNCPANNTDPACSTSVTALTPALAISKVASTATTTPGGTVGYTITATNTGQTTYTAAQISDDLAGVLSDATYGGGAIATRGSVAVVGQRLTWTGDVAPGQAVVITYGVVVNNPDLGDKLMVNRVTSDELGSTCPTGGTGSACTSSVTVLVPALDIVIAASSSTTTPGAQVGYTLTITNAGQTDYLAAQVSASLVGVLDDATYAGGATATAGSTAFSESTLTWTGSLAVGATATVTYQVTVNKPVSGNQLMSTSVSSAQPGSTCTAGAPCVNTVTVLIPGLAISTTADVATATPGDRVRFTIRVQNTGQTQYTGTSVSTALGAVLDDATFDGTVTATSGVASYAAGDVTWTGDLAVGGDAVLITYTVTIRDPDPGDKLLTTTVLSSAAGSTCPAGTSNAACTATVTVLVPALTITKTASAPTTTPGATVTYTIVVQNTGQTAHAGATVSDSLAEVLPHAAYNGDVAATGGGTVTYDAPVLRWTGDLLIGATATITYSVTAAQEQSGDKLLTNRVVSTAPGSTCPAGSTRPACSVTVQVLIPALQITKTADRSTVVAGDPVRYTVTLRNTGETAYAPATFTDPLADVLDDATWADDAVASSGTLEYVNETLAWTGPLARDAVATISYSVRADFPTRGDRVLDNQVSSQSAGATCPAASTAPECRSVVTVLVPALTVTKTADTSRMVAGGTVRYTIQATNTGQAAYPAASLSDNLSGVLDDAVYRGDAVASTGVLGYAPGTLSWTGGLAVGQGVTITYSVTVNLAPVVGASLVNVVGSSSVGSTCPGGAGCTSTVGVDARMIGISGLTDSFTLTGLPGSTVQKEGAVGMTVTTNSSGGYSVSVRGTAGVLEGSTGNPDSIPIQQLQVRDSGQQQWHPLSAVNPFVVHTKTGPSAAGGDAVANDYQVQIPFVASDTYSTTLEYIVTAQ